MNAQAAITTRHVRIVAGLGRRAGERYRATGVPERCPFPAEHQFSKVWEHAYVEAAYRRRSG